jgi:hypothetical protein
MMAPSLTEIANDEATDKGTRGPMEPRGHNYTDIYESYLSSRRDKEITLLEIGLGVQGPIANNVWLGGRNPHGGASMRMWYRYFPKARILGIDVNPASFLDNERVRTCVVDQGDAAQLRSFLKELRIDSLDVIVDDGSHLPHHQQISVSTLFPFLAPGGLYFIEDLLENGVGDPRRRQVSSVLNTRRVFTEFARTGSFPEPNAFVDEATFAKDISSVAFHCPPVVARSTVLKPLSRAKAAAKFLFGTQDVPVEIEYKPPGREKLCVLIKA